MVELPLLKKHFPEMDDAMLSRYEEIKELYIEWNQKINVISRKDMEHFEERHILHSLSIAKLNLFKPGQKVMDLGAGGGFPGIPLAIYYPDTHFTLVDSIRKKTVVMQEVVDALKLENVTVVNARAEDLKQKFNYVVCRAVAPLLKLSEWCYSSIDKSKIDFGMLCLKGGDLLAEITEFEEKYKNVQVISYKLQEFYPEEFFETKKIVRLLNY